MAYGLYILYLGVKALVDSVLNIDVRPAEHVLNGFQVHEYQAVLVDQAGGLRTHVEEFHTAVS